MAFSDFFERRKMRGNMNKKRVTEIFFLDAKHEFTTFDNVVANRIDLFMAKYIDGKVSRWPGEMRLYFSDNLWPYVLEYVSDFRNDIFQFRNHTFYHTVHRDSALGTNKMRIEYTWEEKEMGPDRDAMDALSYTKLFYVDSKVIDTKIIKPKKVIFHNPATIVYWSDGTKTVVKKQKGDRWDQEKGLAMCYIKKFIGLKEFYHNLSSSQEG